MHEAQRKRGAVLLYSSLFSRQRVKSLIAARRRSEQLIGSFAIEILNKRLLSGPYAFAERRRR